MRTFSTKEEKSDLSDRLKNILHEIESADDVRQYVLLLKAAQLAFFLEEGEESLSYLLQASLIENSYEVNVALFYLYASKKCYSEAVKYLDFAARKHYSQLEIFSWEELHSWLSEPLPDDISQSLAQLRELPTISSEEMEIPFPEILKEAPLHAAEIFHSWKENSGLSSKYPELSSLSIHKWEEEFPNRKEIIKQKEFLRYQNVVLEFEELMELGKMYILENEFEKAAECFSSAKDLYLSKLP